MQQKLKNRAAKLSIASNSTLVLLKLGAGISMHSVSVISEAAHSGIDLVAALIAYLSVRESGKPADETHRFGHGKFENVAAVIEALLILAAALFIIVEGVKKLISGRIVIEQLDAGAAVMAISAMANFLVSSHLRRVARSTDSAALEADAMHLRTDVYTSVGVFAGLIAIRLTGLGLFDPLCAIGIALLIIKTAFGLIRCSIRNILDARLPDEEESIIHQVMSLHASQFLEYHKLRTRKSGHIRQIDMHLVVPKGLTVEAGHALSHTISRQIEERLDYSQVLVHIEPCRADCEGCLVDCSYRDEGRK